MIAVLQRVSDASVQVNNQTLGKISQGFVILLGVFDTDTEDDTDFLVNKIAGFRVFNDKNQKMNRSIRDVSGEVLVVSQFTLCGDWLKGRRPSFIHAARPEKGKKLYLDFIEKLQDKDLQVETGEFGAMMNVELVNDGPVTFVLDSQKRKP